MILTARIVDRVGKGIRGSPRDALVADMAPPELRGAAFGLRQSLDTVGAFAGPLIAVGLMLLWSNNFQAIFWVAVIPAAMSVALLAIGVTEPPPKPGAVRQNPIGVPIWPACRLPTGKWSASVPSLRWPDSVRLSWFCAHSKAASSGHGSFGHCGDEPCLCPVGLPAGPSLRSGQPEITVDRRAGHVDSGRPHTGQLEHVAVVLAGVAVWGIHMGMTQGLLAVMVADTAPADLRGTAYGFFNLVSGVALLVASLVAGILWDSLGAPRPS